MAKMHSGGALKMSNISLQSVTKYYGKELILDNISLDIKDKEFLCITGPSGCGKTTLLRIIAGLDTDYGGKIFMDGIDCKSLSPADRNISMVFQEYALYPNLRAKDNISFPLRIKRYSRSRVAEKLKTTVKLIDLGVEQYLDFFPKELSAGHRQRVATGRAVVRDNPSIFLLDEPLSSLDAKIRMNTRFYLNKLITNLSATTVYVTSDSSEAMALADRVVVLNNGKFIQVDRPYDIYYHPKSMVVADFFGLLGMNFIRGCVKGNEFCFDEYSVRVPACIKKEALDKLNKEKELILGVRPEDINFSKDKGINKVKAKVDLIQGFPPKANIRCKFKDDVINVICFLKNIADITTGMDIYLSFDKNKVHLFYPDSGNLVSS